jgi:pimeloyl-ACP methyl ester carboxylesterase
MWEPLLPPLRERGVAVDVVERLPSVGDDVAHLRDPYADMEHVRERVAALGRPVALCGHSYGGMVIADLADHPAVCHSIYLAAFWPVAGRSLADLVGPAGLPDWIVDRGDGTTTVSDDLEHVRQALFADLDADRAAAVHRRLEPQAAIAFTAPSRAPRASHPVTYILCTEDRAIPLAAQEAMSQRADWTIRLQSDHCPQLSHPVDLAGALATTLGRPPAGAARV